MLFGESVIAASCGFIFAAADALAAANDMPEFKFSRRTFLNGSGSDINRSAADVKVFMLSDSAPKAMKSQPAADSKKTEASAKGSAERSENTAGSSKLYRRRPKRQDVRVHAWSTPQHRRAEHNFRSLRQSQHPLRFVLLHFLSEICARCETDCIPILFPRLSLNSVPPLIFLIFYHKNFRLAIFCSKAVKYAINILKGDEDVYYDLYGAQRT